MEDAVIGRILLQALRIVVAMALFVGIGYLIFDFRLKGRNNDYVVPGILLGGVVGWLLRNGPIPRWVAWMAGLVALAGMVAISIHTRSLPHADEMEPYARGMIAGMGMLGCIGGWLALLLFVRWTPRTPSRHSA